LIPPAEPEAAFAEPWHAQAFAVAMQLSRGGAFTWSDWVAVFSAEIRAHPARAGEDSSSTYYRQFLAALETILEARGYTSRQEIATMQARWDAAYRATPHGMPVALENAGMPHEHTLAAVPRPVAVSPAGAGR
jgi:nitrile hydratase accessory protein